MGDENETCTEPKWIIIDCTKFNEFDALCNNCGYRVHIGENTTAKNSRTCNKHACSDRDVFRWNTFNA